MKFPKMRALPNHLHLFQYIMYIYIYVYFFIHLCIFYIYKPSIFEVAPILGNFRIFM